ncbi:MAG: cytochrome C oxidase subunit IV family protein [Ignavibacteria bacterium]
MSFYRRNLGIGLLLLILLAATTASAYAPLGAWNGVLNLAIAALKIGLVAGFFMRLSDAGGLVRLAAGIALLMLAIFLSLASTDYLTRRVTPAPWQSPRDAHPFLPPSEVRP